ncbi:DoxX family protein [Subtercola sp. YIM 133946]|uniref:DoxX family protein n=1 Tax=Subtercola sp. YIM 133946 TaxID=3118909 RepID=UPI002F949A56
MSKLAALVARPPVSTSQTVARLLLGGVLAFAGISHLTRARQEFQAQVPTWVPLPADTVVVASGVVEVGLGTALLALPKQRVSVGLVAAAFFIAIFPGNISQLVTHTDAFRLNSDRARALRLIFQPLLVLWALWSTGALKALSAAR